MNRPLATPPLDLAAAAKPAAAGRPLFWPIILAVLLTIVLVESQLDWGRFVGANGVTGTGNAQPTFDFAAGGRIDRSSDYTDYLAAPIFLATREPIFLPDPNRISVTPAQLGELGLALLGTVLSEGEPVAVMKTMPGGDVVRLRPGEELGGWTLIEIEGRLVRLQRAGKTIEVNLDPNADTGQSGSRGD